MDDVNSGRPKPWSTYAEPGPSPSQPGGTSRDVPWRSSFGTSMNAISFGFVATAILISMFLIMAIFEHLFRPNPSFSSPEQMGQNAAGSRTMSKLADHQQTVQRTSYAPDFSVVMPGQQYPSYIAQPAPLPREGIKWPPHEHSFVCP